MPVSHTSYWLEYKIGRLLSTDVVDQKQSYLLAKLRIKNTWKENKVHLAAHILIILDLVRLRWQMRITCISGEGSTYLYFISIFK